MTRQTSNITNVYAMGKGFTEVAASTVGINTAATSASNYSGNFLEKATYNTPLNPLLVRGAVTPDMADFTTPANVEAINSYEIHKADNATLTKVKTGIYNSNGSTQTYGAVNRIFPSDAVVDSHLSNKQTTRGNTLRTYDYQNDSGQRLVHERTLVNEAVDATETVITLDSVSNLAINDIVIIDNEEMKITGIAGVDITVERGYKYTTAVAHDDNSVVFEKEIIDSLWVLVYSDDANLHHFAKITEILEYDVWGDAIEFSPAIGVDIPKDTKFAIFSSKVAAFTRTDSDNQTLVACGYGLLGGTSNNRHYLNTHVSRPFFYFLNGMDRLEPATRYILRTSSFDGTNHTYTYSTFLTEPAYSGDIIDYGPYTMEASLVDMLYKADNPAAMDFLEYSDNSLNLNENGGSADTITVASDTSFDNTHTDLDGTEGTNWGLLGILRDSRFIIASSANSSNDLTYCVDSVTDSTITTLTLDVGDLTADDDVGTTSALRLRMLAHAVDLDHNEMYGAFSSSDDDDTIGGSNVGYFAMVNAFRMGHRPNVETSTSYYAHDIGYTRYMHYADSPLTNNIAPNALEMIDYESVTSTGGYVDIIFIDTSKILAKKIKQGDTLDVHQIVTSEEVDLDRVAKLVGTFEYDTTLGTSQILVKDLGNNEDLRFALESSIPNSRTDTSSQFDPLFDAFTIDVSGVLYHFVPDRISNVSSNTQTITVKYWRKETDTEYNTTSLQAGLVPNFSGNAYRKRYSFLADNILTSEIPIDSKIDGYSLDYNGASAVPTNRNLTNFENLINSTASLLVGNTSLVLDSESRINDINLVFKGGQMTGHRINISYGDSFNSIVKLQTHLKDERFLELYNKTDYKPYSDRLTGISLYNYAIDSSLDAASSLYRYDLDSPASVGNTHVRGVNSYLDYFDGTFDIEKKVFSGFVESIEQVVEDGMFKLKVRGRNSISKLLGPIVNKNYKFTEDIIYSTVGPIENMVYLGKVDYYTGASEGSAGSNAGNGVYEVGDTTIVVNATSGSLTFPITVNKGDLLFTKEGTLLGRIHAYTGLSGNDFRITLEEGIPVRMRNMESIFITKQTPFSNIVTKQYDINATSEIHYANKRSNTVSFAKALSSNPFISTKVNSLEGTSDKGIIFTGGNSLTDTTDGAPALEGKTLVGTSSSPHKLAKGYSIHAPTNIYFDLPFYCNLADEITDKHTIDYTNLHTVNSLTEYAIVNVSSKEGQTITEIAPICPAILARVDRNNLDNRDKYLRSSESILNGPYSIGYNGPLHFTAATSDDAVKNLMVNDIIYKTDGTLIGKIIDISRAFVEGSADDDIVITLDRPLTTNIVAAETVSKYQWHDNYSTYSRYHLGTTIRFLAGTDYEDLGDSTEAMNIFYSAAAGDQSFFNTLRTGMRIEIQGSIEDANNGTFTIGKTYGSTGWSVFPRKISGTNVRASSANTFKTDTSDNTCTIKVLTDHFTQGLYFLNTQGLSQGGVLTLTNPILSSPNLADNICKPIKWAGNLYHYITDNSLDVRWNGAAVTKYNPNDSAHTIYSDFIDRYGNTKWRYFGLQKGQSLSHISRRRKDGLVKDTYTKVKGKVSGYASAYRIADAVHGTSDIFLYPYGYHNNDFSLGVHFYDALHSDYVDTYNFLSGEDTGSSPSTEDNTRFHPYFLEYLSPESRDFRPVMGSNFADLDKHGTWLTSPNTATSANYNILNIPRYMPRLHDNFRGGDWQQDMEAPVNPDNSTLTDASRVYSDVKTVSAYNFSLAKVSTSPRLLYDFSNSNREVVMASLRNNWIKISGTTDRNSNRTFYLNDSYTDASNTRKVKFDSPHSDAAVMPPYIDWEDVNGTATTTTGTSISDHAATGAESITTLYPPYIGPKVDGITRAKDHWELPDPKTMRWFIFSPADMFPDSMARQNHIGYSETLDATAIARKFTDYNLLLKGDTITGQGATAHEHYEGSLNEEYETDDDYETLPITAASITPSQIKRFGLMRLIDCTYDWHFNLIDPERLPSNMQDMTTPNFQYTRFQALRKTTLYSGNKSNAEDDSYDVILTTDEDGTAITPVGQVLVGDNIFTYHGKYLGTVEVLDGSNKKITVLNRIELPQIKNKGESYQYRGPIYVCGDATLAVASQTREDSYYTFSTLGQGGRDTFTEKNFNSKLHMLQMMVNADKSYYDSGSDARFEYFQVPYGAIHSPSTGKGTAIIYSGYSGDLDANIDENKFMNHFNENLSKLKNQSGTVSNTGAHPTIVLPPAFKTFYSKHTTSSNLDRTINVMQSKEYLVNKTEGSATNNGLATEYSHVSNILEWTQGGGNPYAECGLVTLGRYPIENAGITKTPIGGLMSIYGNISLADGSSVTQGFAYSRPSRTATPTGITLAEQKYGDGFGGLSSDYGAAGAVSSEYSILTTQGDDDWGYAMWRDDGDSSQTLFYDTNNASYIADGIFGAFVPRLNMNSIHDTEIADGTTSETSEGTIVLDSINGITKIGVIRFEMDETSGSNRNAFLNFTDLTGMYLVGNIGYEHGGKTQSMDYAPFNSAHPNLHDSNMNWWSGATESARVLQNNSGLSSRSLDNAMIDPKHIMYVHEHRRNVTGKVVAHELLVDNIPHDDDDDVAFTDVYRIMRPAEHCFVKESPTEIKINTISSRTTKKPQENSMYGYTPSLSKVNIQGEFKGADNISTSDGGLGENEAVMSMYVAIDMDSRHAQHKTLTGTIALVQNTKEVTGSGTSFESELQNGDVLHIGNQHCYVEEITSNTALKLATKYIGTTLTSTTIKLSNNKFTVLRDYTHLFNPTGNRNTFKSGSSYSMLLTDGVSKQKMSMAVEADYWDNKALCKLSFGNKFSEDMLGIVSLGEIFTLTSSVPAKLTNVVSARIGSTVIIGSEVEDIVNDLLSSENIEYNIKDEREYPYYLSPNYQGLDIFSAANFAARYKNKEIRIDETGIALSKQSRELDVRPIELSYENPDLRIIEVTRNKTTFDLYNEVIVYGNGVKSIKRNRKSIDEFGKKTLEDANLELISQDDVDSRASLLLSAHSEGDDRFTIKMSKTGIEFIKAGDIISLDFPAEGISKRQYKVYEIRRELAGLIELEIGTYSKALADRFAELMIKNRSNTASIRGDKFKENAVTLDFFDTVKIKQLRLVVNRIGLAETDAFTLGFQTDTDRLLDFGDTLAPLETITETLIDEDFL